MLSDLYSQFSLGAILLSLYYVFLWKNPHTQAALQKAKVITILDADAEIKSRINLAVLLSFILTKNRWRCLFDAKQIQGLNTSTSPVLLETTVPPDFGDLQPREEGQISELRWLQSFQICVAQNKYLLVGTAFCAGCSKQVQRLSQNERGAFLEITKLHQNLRITDCSFCQPGVYLLWLRFLTPVWLSTWTMTVLHTRWRPEKSLKKSKTSLKTNGIELECTLYIVQQRAMGLFD